MSWYCPKCGYPNPDNLQTCFKCSSSRYPINPSTTQSVSVVTQMPVVPITPDCFWIDLDNLRPLEKLLWELQSTKLTEAQTMALIREEGLQVEDHPAFQMIMNDPHRNRLVICSHSSHNTPEKKEECVQAQAAKLAARTVRHYLGHLERHQIWANQPENPLSYAMWTCIERGGHVACASCRAREGIIERVGSTRVMVLHPNCHCTLTYLAPGSLGDSTIKRIVNYLGNTDPARAQQFANNVKNSGWVFSESQSSSVSPHQPNDQVPVTAGCCGCALAIVLIIITGITVAACSLLSH